MRKLVTVAAIAAFSGGASMAVAADLGGMPDPMTPPPPMLTNWSGFYFGLGVGGVSAFSHAKTQEGFAEYAVFPGITNSYYSTRDFDLGGQGVLGTIQLGYDYQFPASRWVGGVFADYDWAGVNSHSEALTWYNGSLVDPVTGVPYSPSGNVKADFNNEWTIGGRLGYLATPHTLLYVLAGYTQGQAKLEGYFPAMHPVGALVVPPYMPFSQTVTSGGWSAGLGIETQLRENWYLKFEYRYSQFGSGTAGPYVSGLYNDAATACAVGDHCYNDYRKADANTDAQTARVVLTYKLNRQQFYDPLK